MQLKLKRSQRTGGMLGGKVFFALDARADLTEEERALVEKYKLGTLIVYDSEARKKHEGNASAHFGAASGQGYDLAGARTSLWKTTRGLASMAMAALTLRVTIGGLMEGQHIECKELVELMGAEKAIVEACENLKGYLETAVTFDGREEVVEF